MSPPTQLLASSATEPLQQCMAVELWVVAVVGVVLPAATLRGLDRRARQRYQQVQLAGAAAAAAGDAGLQQQAQQVLPPLPPALPPSLGGHVVQLYLTSCMAWCGVYALLALRGGGIPTAALS